MATVKRNQNQIRYDKPIYLRKKTVTTDSIGNQKATWPERLVFGRELSVGAVEYYNAALKGLRPEIQLETYQGLYDGSEKVRYKDVVYNVIRTKPSGDKIVLVCERIGADANQNRPVVE